LFEYVTIIRNHTTIQEYSKQLKGSTVMPERHVRTEICTLTEYCTQCRNELDYGALGQVKQNLQQLGHNGDCTVFHKFLEPSRHFTLKMDSDIHIVLSVVVSCKRYDCKVSVRFSLYINSFIIAVQFTGSSNIFHYGQQEHTHTHMKKTL
jgi:hypothetical protein